GRSSDLKRGLHSVPHRTFTDCRARRDDGRLAVLRAASIRGDNMGRGDGLEPAWGGFARQFALRLAAAAALVQRQYWRASRASLVERRSLLSASRGLADLSGAERDRPAHSVAQPRLRASRVVGGGKAAALVVSRGAERLVARIESA